MAAGTDVLKFALALFVILAVKRPSFTNANSLCYSETSMDIIDCDESFVYSSLWQYSQQNIFLVRRKYLLNLLLLLSGDIHPCPGPARRICCYSCSKTIRKNQSSGTCLNCKERLHLKCMKDSFRNGTESLYCSICFVQDPVNEDAHYSNPVLNSFTKKRGMKIFHQNVNGLIHKMDQVKLFLASTQNNIHIFGISETHANASMTNIELAIDGYNIERKDRNKGTYGGVISYIRSELTYERRSDLESDGIESIWLEIFIEKSKSILVCVMYKPPDSSSHLDKNFTSKFDDMISTVISENKEVILSGDLNCNYLIPTDHRDIKDIIRINGFKQIIDKPTRVSKNTKSLIDIIASNNSSKIADSIVVANSISDHDIIGIIRKMHIKKPTPRTIFIRDYSKFDTENYKNDLRNTQWENMFLTQDINGAWNIFKTLLSYVIKKHAPLREKKVKGNDCPWLNKQIKEKMQTRDYLLKRARKTNNSLDWSNYKLARNDVTRSIKRSKANYYRNLFRDNVENPKQFWRQLKRAFPTKSQEKAPRSLNIDGDLITNNKKMSNAFCSFFTNVGSSLNKKFISLCNSTWKSFNFENRLSKINPDNHKFKFKEVNLADVLRILKKLHVGKACGIDNIPAKLIKDGAEELCAPLMFLANYSFRSGVFPTQEKCGKINPLHKSGTHTSMDNYRPISVLNTLSKVIERLAYQQISDYLESNNLLCPHQYGFRRGRSTQHAVTKFADSIRHNMDQSNCTGALYMDLKKAFDTVHHGCLLQKLPLYGINNIELTWITDYLFNRSQYVVIDNIASDSYHITHGVPQGSILGPLLFIILINDIHHDLKICNILLYADDAVIYYANKDPRLIEEVINHEANLIASWFRKNNLFLNLSKGKTEFVLYGSKQKIARNSNCNITIDHTKINNVTSYEYLGVILDRYLCLNHQIDKIYKKTSSRLKLLYRIRPNITPTVAESIYASMIKPIIFYCYPVYCNLSRSANTKLQSIQDRACNIIKSKNRIVIWPTVECIRKRRICTDVFKSIHKIGHDMNLGLFVRQNHSINTRGNNSLLTLNKVRTEAGRSTFFFQGALLFNQLNEELRNETDFTSFKNGIDTFEFRTSRV